MSGLSEEELDDLFDDYFFADDAPEPTSDTVALDELLNPSNIAKLEATVNVSSDDDSFGQVFEVNDYLESSPKKAKMDSMESPPKNAENAEQEVDAHATSRLERSKAKMDLMEDPPKKTGNEKVICKFFYYIFFVIHDNIKSAKRFATSEYRENTKRRTWKNHV